MPPNDYVLAFSWTSLLRLRCRPARNPLIPLSEKARPPLIASLPLRWPIQTRRKADLGAWVLSNNARRLSARLQEGGSRVARTVTRTVGYNPMVGTWSSSWPCHTAGGLDGITLYRDILCAVRL